jgi:hypothetical protein
VKSGEIFVKPLDVIAKYIVYYVYQQGEIYVGRNETNGSHNPASKRTYPDCAGIVGFRKGGIYIKK